MAVTLFKVIQGHQFCYQWKAHNACCRDVQDLLFPNPAGCWKPHDSPGQYRNVTEWRTDGQTVRNTDGIPLAITALCIASTADALYSRQRPVGDRDSGEVGGGWTSAVKSEVVSVSTFILLGESHWKCDLEEMTQWLEVTASELDVAEIEMMLVGPRRYAR